MKYPLSIPLFQSTLPRRERLFLFAELDLPLDISIHAPAKGATIHFPVRIDQEPQFQSTLPRRERLILKSGETITDLISIHAPAKGATINNGSSIGHLSNFNPRSREGSDTLLVGLQMHHNISIHAPAKGATSNEWKEKVINADFNPRSREGSD